MTHKYRGFRYKLRVLKGGHKYVSFRVYYIGLKNKLRWLMFKKSTFVDGGDYKIDADECEESFIVRVHQAAHDFIDSVAEKRELRASILKVCNDAGVEFLSRISK